MKQEANMKKLFFIFVLLSCFAVGFAETGYRGHQWYSAAESFPKTGQENVNLEYDSTKPIIYKKTILESKTFLFYDINIGTDELESAGYLVPKNKTEQLKKELKSMKKTIYNYDFSEMEIETGTSQLENDFNIFAEFSWITKLFESSMTEQDKEDLKAFKNAEGRITIYDYNDDTRCYIFENAIPDRTVVIYVPHEQDF
jgi:hypothetical protein